MIHTKPDATKIPGFWDIDNANVPNLQFGSCLGLIGTSIIESHPDTDILTIPDLLTGTSCQQLIDLFLNSNILAPVSVNGLMSDKTYGVGSVRATGWSIKLAEMLSAKIIPLLSEMTCDVFTLTDWWQNRDPHIKQTWKPVMISPMLRFMKYDNDSEHFAHYDAGYIYPDEKYRTLKSMVIYLTTNKIGATRFIYDGQCTLPVHLRNHDDWVRRVEQDEVLDSKYPEMGKAIFFNHRLCHDVQQYHPTGDEKYRIIIRGDVIYERVED